MCPRAPACAFPAHRAAWPAHQSWSSPQVYQLGEWHKYSLGFSFSVYCAAFGSSTQLRCQPCGGKQTVPSCRFTGVCRIPVCCALWCSWPSTSVLIQQAAALQLLADFLQHGMLGVIQVTADLAPGCAGMAAAAQAARNVAGINAARCTHADAEAAILLLAVGQANLHAFNGARQAGQVLQLGTPEDSIWSQVRQMTAHRSLK